MAKVGNKRNREGSTSNIPGGGSLSLNLSDRTISKWLYSRRRKSAVGSDHSLSQWDTTVTRSQSFGLHGTVTTALARWNIIIRCAFLGSILTDPFWLGKHERSSNFSRVACQCQFLLKASLWTSGSTSISVYRRDVKSVWLVSLTYFCVDCRVLEGITNGPYVLGEWILFLSDQFSFPQANTNPRDFSRRKEKKVIAWTADEEMTNHTVTRWHGHSCLPVDQ